LFVSYFGILVTDIQYLTIAVVLAYHIESIGTSRLAGSSEKRSSSTILVYWAGLCWASVHGAQP